LSTEWLDFRGEPVARHAQAEIRLSVERSILRRQEFERRTSSGGRTVRNIQRKESFEVSQNQQREIHPGGIGIIPDHQIWEKLHGG
jgi:hypothetical protein